MVRSNKNKFVLPELTTSALRGPSQQPSHSVAVVSDVKVTTPPECVPSPEGTNEAVESLRTDALWEAVSSLAEREKEFEHRRESRKVFGKMTVRRKSMQADWQSVMDLRSSMREDVEQPEDVEQVVSASEQKQEVEDVLAILNFMAARRARQEGQTKPTDTIISSTMLSTINANTHVRVWSSNDAATRAQEVSNTSGMPDTATEGGASEQHIYIEVPLADSIMPSAKADAPVGGSPDGTHTPLPVAAAPPSQHPSSATAFLKVRLQGGKGILSVHIVYLSPEAIPSPHKGKPIDYEAVRQQRSVRLGKRIANKKDQSTKLARKENSPTRHVMFGLDAESPAKAHTRSVGYEELVAKLCEPSYVEKGATNETIPPSPSHEKGTTNAQSHRRGSERLPQRTKKGHTTNVLPPLSSRSGTAEETSTGVFDPAKPKQTTPFDASNRPLTYGTVRRR